MINIDSEKKIAVLIDAENTSYSILDNALKELSKHGHIIVKKAYGDWSSSYLRNWKEHLNELAISPVQQFSYTQGKNSSDAAMIIDAMDLLYSNKFDAFVLFSSDSDFTKLASRLKESEIYVFGVGKKQTPKAFINACDDFLYSEVFSEKNTDKEITITKEKKETKTTGLSIRNKLRMDTNLVKLLRYAASECMEEDGWSRLAQCGSLIKRQHPDFNFKNYNDKNYKFDSLSKLVEATELFDINKKHLGKGSACHIFIRNKNN
ncbi:NYN domain-containing protein [Pelagibaculum spongiae]|uniref:HTH OST-type domain-containing protein n=1 Tax=Pelagibaculum spongiae TaxID=2080658 RepID=A0A2V1GZL6_9GAMM|nr:NYN domain-containing protein [Pelagibaculum spongiae]PVZ68233.1 hypothetical protein DC094_13115 [Pelagibaculum spongiae]